MRFFAYTTQNKGDTRIEKYWKLALFLLPIYFIVAYLVRPKDLQSAIYDEGKIKRGGIYYYLQYNVFCTFICFGFFFVSCKHNLNGNDQLKNSKRVEMILIDSFGTVAFNCPDRYDTSFSWTDFSDCNTCHNQKYRFQSSQATILKESGWASTSPTDSIDRFTISHKLNISNFPKDTSKDVVSHNNFKENLGYTKSHMRMIGDTIYKINDRYFSLFTFESVDSLQRKEVIGITKMGGNDIIFDCELITGKHDSISSEFVANSVKLINSITIKDNQR